MIQGYRLSDVRTPGQHVYKPLPPLCGHSGATPRAVPTLSLGQEEGWEWKNLLPTVFFLSSGKKSFLESPGGPVFKFLLS